MRETGSPSPNKYFLAPLFHSTKRHSITFSVGGLTQGAAAQIEETLITRETASKLHTTRGNNDCLSTEWARTDEQREDRGFWLRVREVSRFMVWRDRESRLEVQREQANGIEHSLREAERQRDGRYPLVRSFPVKVSFTDILSSCLFYSESTHYNHVTRGLSRQTQRKVLPKL